MLNSCLGITIVLLSCDKNHDNCTDITQPSGDFIFKELIGDTAFSSDTIFRNNYIQIGSVDEYDAYSWKVGTDPRIWTTRDFTLNFHTALGSIPVTFNGAKLSNSYCFPNNGQFSKTKNLTLVEQVEKPLLTLSPLVGHYCGYFTDAPTDTFTVRLEYFDSTKYDVAVTGSKNFYWLSNMPKGFTSSLSLPYPELRQGYTIEMGYKSFAFGSGSSMVQGKAWLAHDTLLINYGNELVGRRKFIGKRN